MREDQEFGEWGPDWTQEQDDRLRASLGALRHDVDAAGIPDVRFVLQRAGRQRHRAVAGIAAGAAAVLGLSWIGYQAIDHDTTTAPPAGTSIPTEQEDDSTVTDGETSTQEATTTDEETDEAPPVDPEDLVLAESGGPELSLFVPPPLWASDAFTGGAEAVSGSGEFESTALFQCDPDDVRWGTEDEGTFGVLGVWSSGSAFAHQRVRVLESPEAADSYVSEVEAALAGCQAPAEADNIAIDVEPLELTGSYRLTTTFQDGTAPMTDFYYVIEHEGTPEAVSTFALTDYSGDVTDAEAVDELQRLAGLATGH